jgi:hypothetical protein
VAITDEELTKVSMSLDNVDEQLAAIEDCVKGFLNVK